MAERDRSHVLVILEIAESCLALRVTIIVFKQVIAESCFSIVFFVFKFSCLRYGTQLWLGTSLANREHPQPLSHSTAIIAEEDWWRFFALDVTHIAI